MKREAKERTEPRISAPKMADYLSTTSASQRESIIRDQKFPAAFKVARYQAASDEIRKALVKGDDIPSHLRSAVTRINAKPRDSVFDSQSAALSIQAVEHFQKLLPRIPLKGTESAFIGARGLYVPVEGVTISTFPSVLLKHQNKGRTEVGALLLVLRKEKALSDCGGEAAAEILRTALLASGIALDAAVAPKLCIVVDVFHESIYSAPSRSTRLHQDIESACREIKVRWSQIGRRAA